MGVVRGLIVLVAVFALSADSALSESGGVPPEECSGSLQPDSLAHVRRFLRQNPKSEEQSPARYFWETLYAIRERGYLSIASFMPQDVLDRVVDAKNMKRAEQLDRILDLLSTWKRQLTQRIEKIDSRRDANVFGRRETDPETADRAEIPVGAVSNNAALDGDRNDLINAASELAELREELALRYLPLFHTLDEQQSHFVTNRNVPVLLLTSWANEPLDRTVEINGSSSRLHSNDIDAETGLVWTQGEGSTLLKLVRLHESDGHWLWVFLTVP